MSSNVETERIPGITNKWVLAKCISGHAEAPEQALNAIFNGAMQQLELVTKTNFEASMKDRVWDKVSRERLKTLKDAFTLEFCDKILGPYDEEEAMAILEEHRRTGHVSCLQIGLFWYTSSIIESVVQKANSMKNDWLPEIISALKSEGIEIPE